MKSRWSGFCVYFMHTLDILNLGSGIGYLDALAIQREVHDLRAEGKIPDRLLLLEHRPVYTLGRSTLPGHLLLPPEKLSEAGIECIPCDRGGDITYHGPGQLVGYPIIHLPEVRLKVVEYVTALEEVLIRTAQDFGIYANRDPRNRGVWVGNSKLAALGIRVSRQVTMHGFALNVTTKLSDFRGIVPCGLDGVGVTSFEKILGKKAPPMDEVIRSVAVHFQEVLHYTQLHFSSAPSNAPTD